MSNYIPRPIDRVINLYTVLEPSKNIIFLEGKQDYQFYSTHAKKLETNLTFSEINTVDFSSLEITFPSNLERNNNRGLSKKKWAALIILNLQENSNLLKFKYEQRRKR